MFGNWDTMQCNQLRDSLHVHLVSNCNQPLCKTLDKRKYSFGRDFIVYCKVTNSFCYCQLEHDCCGPKQNFYEVHISQTTTKLQPVIKSIKLHQSPQWVLLTVATRNFFYRKPFSMSHFWKTIIATTFKYNTIFFLATLIVIIII